MRRPPFDAGNDQRQAIVATSTGVVTPRTGSERAAAALAEPVHADEGQQMVDVDRILGQLAGRVRPFADLLDDPGELHDRRVGEPVGNRLWPGRLEGEVAEVPGARCLEGLQPLLLLGREVVGRWRVLRGDRPRIGHDQRADDPLPGEDAQLLGDARADVAAVHAVPLVAESEHDCVEGGCRLLDAKARPDDRRRKAEARKRRDHDVERVLCAAAVRLGVDERPDHAAELHERARVAVGQQQRGRLQHGRPDVNEVDWLPVDVRDELGKLV